MTPETRQNVLALYDDVDREVAAAGPVCVASGRCCRFKEHGHVLYLSHLEAAVLLDAAPPYEQPVSDAFCPFQKEKLCTARACRPLGCRIYFCDPSYGDKGHPIMEKALQRLRDLAEADGAGWRYAPLHVFLNDPELVHPTHTPAS